MVHGPGGGDDHVGRPVVLAEEPAHVIRRHGHDAVLGAQHIPTERVAREESGREPVVDEVGGLVAVHQDHLEDHLTLGLELVWTQGRRPHDVAQHVEPEIEVLGQKAHVERRVLLGREGVHVTSDGVDGLGDGPRRPRRRPLEQEVLQEMRGADLAGPLVPGACPHPEPGGH